MEWIIPRGANYDVLRGGEVPESEVTPLHISKTGSTFILACRIPIYDQNPKSCVTTHLRSVSNLLKYHQYYSSQTPNVDDGVMRHVT